tara:strand:- start:965 stop:1816 length:852 start_codon:yes stop_codon:yes gene_type:complete
MSVFVSTCCVKNRNVIECCDTLINKGINSIELSSGKYSPDTNQYLKNKSKFINFQVHNYFPPPKKSFVFNLASEDKKIQRLSINFAQRAIMLSKKLNRPFYSFHAGYLVDPKPNELGGKVKNQKLFNRSKALERFIRNVKKLSKFANKNNVSLLIENNVLQKKEFNTFKKNSVLMSDPVEMMYVMKKTPKNIGLLLDLAHLKVSSNSLKFNLVNATKKLKKYIRGYHLSDNNGYEDSNKIINKNTWFWPHIKNNLDYYSLEIYNYDIKKIIKALNLTKKKLKK